ncbi:MAG TPA: hypothetical protein VI278_15935 [Nitrososphaeraceae archaeon]
MYASKQFCPSRLVDAIVVSEQRAATVLLLPVLFEKHSGNAKGAI